jgi:hypothetical protein
MQITRFFASAEFMLNECEVLQLIMTNSESFTAEHGRVGRGLPLPLVKPDVRISRIRLF